MRCMIITKVYRGGGGRFHDYTYINASQDVNNSTIQRQENSYLNVNISFLFVMFYVARSHDVLFRVPRAVSTNNQKLHILRSFALKSGLLK